MKTTRFLPALLGAILMTGCASYQMPVYTAAEARLLSDEYLRESFRYHTDAERVEFMRRKNAETNNEMKEAACIFGVRAALSRKKLGCEEVEGTPEYKAKYGS